MGERAASDPQAASLLGTPRNGSIAEGWQVLFYKPLIFRFLLPECGETPKILKSYPQDTYKKPHRFCDHSWITILLFFWHSAKKTYLCTRHLSLKNRSWSRFTDRYGSHTLLYPCEGWDFMPQMRCRLPLITSPMSSVLESIGSRFFNVHADVDQTLNWLYIGNGYGI